MQYLVTGEQMKRFDENTSEHFGVPPAVLMEQAAQAFVEKLLELCPKPERILFACGCGNNGGDGIAAARLMNQRGIAASVIVPRREGGSPLFRLQWQIYRSYGYPLVRSPGEGKWDVVVDALFGTGLSRPLGEPFASLIRELNQLPVHRIAMDIASGVDAEEGKIQGVAFHAEDTVTFSFAKAGSCIWPGSGESGRVHVVPIGITEQSFLGEVPQFRSFTREDLKLLPKRSPHSNKGTYGKLLVIAGSRNMAGAAVLAAQAAYRTGCGLVRILTVEENRDVVLSCVPEAVLSLYGEKIEEQELIGLLGWADAIVIGPGLGTGGTAEAIVKTVLLHRSTPIVVDADALNILARHPVLFDQVLTGGMIVTPHPGEMSRLTGDSVAALQSRLLRTARTFAAEKGCMTVLKDSHTITALPDGRAYVNLSGNHGMATAGSGDVLAGIIGGLLVQGMEPELAAPFGVYLHGLAGDAARERFGAAGMLARDIIDGIIEVQKSLAVKP